jgi:hypothetical protein
MLDAPLFMVCNGPPLTSPQFMTNPSVKHRCFLFCSLLVAHNTVRPESRPMSSKPKFDCTFSCTFRKKTPTDTPKMKTRCNNHAKSFWFEDSARPFEATSVVAAVNDDAPNDDSDTSMPGLLPRFVPVTAAFDHNSDNNSMPCLVCHPATILTMTPCPASLHAAPATTTTTHHLTTMTSTTMILGLLSPTNVQTLHRTLHHLVSPLWWT